jgi:hypothetical protein
MSHLQTPFDQFALIEAQFSWYGEYLIDDEVDSDIA